MKKGLMGYCRISYWKDKVEQTKNKEEMIVIIWKIVMVAEVLLRNSMLMEYWDLNAMMTSP